MFTLNNRAVDLVDESGKVRENKHGVKLKALGLACKVITKADNLPERTIRMVASTEDQDRMGDVILADGWVLDAYAKNPVILWGHNHWEPAIARASKTWVEDKQLIQDWNFPKAFGEVHGLSELLYVGYMENIFNASSVGFAPLKWRNDGFEEGEREELNLGEDGWLFMKQELMEVSAVNVPANPEALQIMQAKGLDTRPLQKMLEVGTVINVRGDDAISTDADDDLLQELQKINEEEFDGEATIAFFSLDETDSTSEKDKKADESGDDSWSVVTTEEMIAFLEDEGYKVLENIGDGVDITYCSNNPDNPYCSKCGEPMIPKGAGYWTCSKHINILTLDTEEDILELSPEPVADDSDIQEKLEALRTDFIARKVKRITKDRVNFMLGIVEEQH